ncbi:MAG: hypothetical protein AAF226_08930 [Verrucomicrobiota bacterium]
MPTLNDAIKVADQLTEEDQAGLASHIISNLRGAPFGPDDAELERREAEMENGTAEVLTHKELCDALGR